VVGLAVWDRIIFVENFDSFAEINFCSWHRAFTGDCILCDRRPSLTGLFACVGVCLSVCVSVYVVMCVCVSAGCFCVYNSKSSLLYVQQSVESCVLSDVRRANLTHLLTLPIVVVLAHNPDVDERTLAFLREEGQLLADR